MSPILAHDVVKPQGVAWAFQAKDVENASAPV
uniref:Putative presegetalin B1 n=1 Tax=Gypsophila vaccaria TaxID=39387 RepID=F6LNL6_GYPVA|nr:putative presegetalin B1 [Gypsophila vaccaria]5O3V_C Chain C, Putative presegetalin B1 [Gypsophila vaccaria]5O3V_D Chain D, Putative presegetalin B1 [Gypsophila vaccaria]